MKADGMNKALKRQIDEMKPFPARDPQKAIMGKAAFLKEASELRATVSSRKAARHTTWMSKLLITSPKRETKPMFKTMIAVVIAAGLFLGGSGVTAYSAQYSQPDQALYQVKLLGEDVALKLSSSTQSRIDRLMDYTDRRIAEIAGQIQAGEPVSLRVEIRLQNQLQEMLNLARGTGDAQMLQLMEQIRLRAQSQLHQVDGLMTAASAPGQALLLQVRSRLQEQIRLCELAQSDPEQFRLLIREQERLQEQLQERSNSGGQGQQNGNGLMNPSITPQNGGGYGPGPSYQQQTPATMPTGAGNSYGSGSTPTAGDAGNGDGNGGNQPTDTSGQQGPGSGN